MSIYCRMMMTNSIREDDLLKPGLKKSITKGGVLSQNMALEKSKNTCLNSSLYPGS